MPDLMTHLVFALILAELFSVNKKSLVALGALLPDMISKLGVALFYLKINNLFSFGVFHTPFIIFLVSILIASLFRHSKIKTVSFIALGMLSHFLLDLTMKHFASLGVRLLFPLTMYNFSFQLIWPDQSIYLLAFAIASYMAILFIKKQKDGKQRTYLLNKS